MTYRPLFASLAAVLLATTTGAAWAQTPSGAAAPGPPASAPSQPARVDYPLPKPSSPPEKDRADAERTRAAQFKKQGLTEGAKDAMRRTYAASGRLEDGRAVADLAEAGGEIAETADVLAFLLKEHDATLKPAERTKLIAKINALDASLALITLDAKQQGASVLVDGRDRGHAPLSAPLRLGPGSHYVEIRLRDYEPFATMLNPSPGVRDTLTVDLKPVSLTGRLDVTASGALDGAHVFIDGRDVGPAPFHGDVEAGPHKVVVKSERASSKEATVVVPLKRPTSLMVDVAALVAKVSVTAEPPDAVLLLDGKIVGRGHYEADLPFGTYQLEARKDGYTPKTLPLKVDGPDPIARSIALAALPQEPEEPPYEGIYGGIGLAGNVDLTPASTPCPAFTQCSQSAESGGALTIDVGWRFGLLGVGLHLQGGGGYQTLELDKSRDPSAAAGSYGAATITEKTDAFDIAGFAGLGARLMTKGSFAFTAGLTPGVNLRHYVLVRTASGDATERVTQSADSTAFASMLDVGLLAGSSPGSKFRLSLYGMGTFRGSDVTTDPMTHQNGTLQRQLEPLSLASSFQMTVGALIGVFFGH